MWPSDILVSCRQMRAILRDIRQSALHLESDEVELLASELEKEAGSLYAAMQTDGIWVGIRDTSNDRIGLGDFGDKGG